MWVQLWQSLIGCSPGGNPRIKRLDQVPLVKVYHILTYVRNIRVEKCSQQWCYVWFYEDLFSVVPFHALIFSLSVIIFVICWLQGSLLCKVKNLLYIVTFTLLMQLILKLVFFFNSTIMYCVAELNKYGSISKLAKMGWLRYTSGFGTNNIFFCQYYISTYINRSGSFYK